MKKTFLPTVVALAVACLATACGGNKDQAAEAVDTVAAPEEVVSQLFPKEIVPLQDTFLIDTSCMEQATCEGMTILKEQGYVMEFAMEGDMARYVFHDKDSETGKKLLEAMQKDSRP